MNKMALSKTDRKTYKKQIYK